MSLAGIENRDAAIENPVSILNVILEKKDRELNVKLLLKGTVG